jgi:hypothetical protein
MVYRELGVRSTEGAQARQPLHQTPGTAILESGAIRKSRVPADRRSAICRPAG